MQPNAAIRDGAPPGQDHQGDQQENAGGVRRTVPEERDEQIRQCGDHHLQRWLLLR